LQELLLNDFVCLTSHSEFINKGINDLFNMYLGQKVLGQINHCLTDMKDLIVQVVRNAVAEHQQEVKQEVPEFYISMKHLWLDILKNEFQEIEHIE
jgi:3-methyladenine DNA glycosylase AlkC